MTTIDRTRLAALHAAEEQRFIDLHPTSARLAAEAGEHLLAGVPMPWMTRWPGSFPLFVESAAGGGFTDVDGIDYVDLCLGDTGSMTGHCLPAVAEAVREELRGELGEKLTRNLRKLVRREVMQALALREN